jgi:sterol desaturase/sphingolipid hydroxylase (fatty acid hydroxylase superfamily)
MLLELMPVLMIAIFLGFLAAERVFPARTLPPVKRWVPKGLFFFVLAFLIGGVLPEAWIPFFSEHAFLDLSGLGIAGGAAVAILASELLSYAWHRLAHGVHPIWRWTHQMHHSAERVDVAGAFYFHPLDSLAFAFVGSAPGAILGVAPEAAAIAGLVAFALAIFQHANLRTPRWLGLFVQRPEGHALHHARGVHAFNYGNIALFDQLFGTYRNPEAYTEAKAGFWDGASAEVGAMLIGKDVATTKREVAIPTSAATV